MVIKAIIKNIAFFRKFILNYITFFLKKSENKLQSRDLYVDLLMYDHELINIGLLTGKYLCFKIIIIFVYFV